MHLILNTTEFKVTLWLVHYHTQEKQSGKESPTTLVIHLETRETQLLDLARRRTGVYPPLVASVYTSFFTDSLYSRFHVT